ncbi:O-acetyltransferase OatA [Lacipirellula limnantheis]|uniref:O-acetyltransferase OatA n=2 Tax=Lacipirellula limnantheis TaxID=2528024 RepID=A0A517TY81_9BACT|nr:O-acetyltransferase OatA [Lacipirellula limnantheis]
MTRSRIPSLDGLRAVAIAFVLLGHLRGTRGFPDSDLEYWLGNYSNLGVLVFFVISGYLITTLLIQEQANTGRISLRLFYARRAIRIFPAYYAFLAVVVAASALEWIQLHRFDLITAATYTVNYYADRSWYVGHLWSLAVEEQFYLLWPLTLKLLGIRRGMWVAAAMFVASPITVGAMRVLIKSDLRDLPIFPAVAGGLAVGCLLAGFRPWLWTQRWYLWLLDSYLMLTLPAVIILLNRTRSSTVGAVFGEPIIYVCIALTMDSCIRNYGNAIGRALNSRPLVMIGVLSYSIYLWQQLFLNRYSSSPWAEFPVNIFAAMAVACVSYFAFEQPLMKLRTRFKAVHKSAKEDAGGR